MVFRTSNSVYEIDSSGKRIRRLEGKENPTPRQGKDGEWRRYSMASEVEVGQPFAVVWDVESSEKGFIGKATTTSPIVSVDDGLIN